MCDRPVTPQAEPFCSERCRLLDLGGWLDERYVVPGDPDEGRGQELAGAERDAEDDR